MKEDYENEEYGITKDDGPLERCEKTVGYHRKNTNVYDEKYLEILEGMCDEDDVKYCFDDYPELCVEDFNEYYEESMNKIDDVTKLGDPIYRGVHIKDYKSFLNALTHKGFTLDHYLGKEKRRNRGAGPYWTWDKSCARAYGSCGNEITDDLVILVGKEPSEVDVDGTIRTNITFRGDEREIRLERGSDVLVTEVCRHETVGKGKNKKMKEICEPFNRRVGV